MQNVATAGSAPVKKVKARSRGFETTFEAHEGLIRKLSIKVFSRVLATGIGMTFDDVFQEACLAYVRAARAYKPERGITFSAYMGRAIINNLNNVVDKLIKERAKHGLAFFCEFSEGDFSIESALPDPSPTVEQVSVRNADIRARIECLSDDAKGVVRELMMPEPHSDKARRVTIGVAARRIGLNRSRTKEIVAEFQTKLGVTLYD